MSYEVEDFQKDIIQASNSTPVVVDFWAQWCGPCRALSPTIEKLAHESKGRWKLVKVDTDRNPDAAIQFNIRGIPNVKMFYEGDVIAEFSGAQPEHIIRKWLDQNLPVNGRTLSDIEQQVNDALSNGDREEARKVLEDVYDEEETADELRAKLAILYLPCQLEKARTLLDAFRNDFSKQQEFEFELQAFDAIEHLKLLKDHPEQLEDEKGASGDSYMSGIHALFEENFEDALDYFLECLALDRQLDDDGARKTCLAIFTLLSEHHPITMKYRRRFSMALY